MVKVLVGALAGAVVSFVWGGLSWMLIPWHESTVRILPNEVLITDTLKTVLKEPGLYMFPQDMNLPAPGEPDGRKAWEQRLRKGPVGALSFSPQGREPMSGRAFGAQFVAGFIISLLLIAVLYAARRTVVGVGRRAAFSALVGVLAALAAFLPMRVWFSFPWDFTLVSIADLVVNFTLIGGAVSRFVPEAE